MILYRKDNGHTPLVSVVICTHNREQFIRQAVNSVLKQKINFPLEIIIGDDASTDGTKEILLKYQKDNPEIFTLILHSKNNGAGSNWAQLMKIAGSKYIAHCDDDDYWHDENKLQKQVDVLEKDITVGLVHTDFRYFYPKKNKYREIKINNFDKKPVFQALFDGEYLIINSTVVFRKELLDLHVSLDDYIKFNFPTQDWVTWMQIAKHTKFSHLPFTTTTYCVSNESVTRSRDFNALTFRYEREKLMYKYICEKFSDDFIYDNNRWEQYVYNLFLKFSFNTADYKRAKFYRNKINKKNVRVLFSKNRMLFNFYIFLKKIFAMR